MNKYQWFGMLCSSICAFAANAQISIDNFEYATDDDLLAAWQPSANATLTMANSAAPSSTGSKSMRIEFSFPSIAWATETVRGPTLTTEQVIGTNQYVIFRLRGDPKFAPSDFRNLYLYAYDADGNFGRWGAPVPITADWQIFNFSASSIEKPWDSPALPDLNRIVQFAFYQYGSEAAIDAYTATVYIDDLMIRDTPLVEFGAPAPLRPLIDDFEGYASDAALLAFYSYENSPATTVTTASLDSPAPQGSKALKLAINFAPGQYPWGSARSAAVAPFSLPTNALVTLRLKGDPALAPIADDGTTFWLSFYDQAGRGINYMTPAAPVISSEWTTLQATLADFSDSSTVDIGNLVRWRILVEGWKGTAEQLEMSGAFYVDDIQITVPAIERPFLTLTQEAGSLKLGMERLNPGTAYELRSSTTFSDWTVATVVYATASTASWTVTPSLPKCFFVLVEKAKE